MASCLLFIFPILLVVLFFQFRFQENVPELAFFQEIPQYMATLNSMLNITENLTDSSEQGSILYLLYDVGKHHHWYHTFCWKSQYLLSCQEDVILMK